MVILERVIPLETVTWGFPKKAPHLCIEQGKEPFLQKSSFYFKSIASNESGDNGFPSVSELQFEPYL